MVRLIIRRNNRWPRESLADLGNAHRLRRDDSAFVMTEAGQEIREKKRENVHIHSTHSRAVLIYKLHHTTNSPRCRSLVHSLGHPITRTHDEAFNKLYAATVAAATAAAAVAAAATAALRHSLKSITWRASRAGGKSERRAWHSRKFVGESNILSDGKDTIDAIISMFDLHSQLTILFLFSVRWFVATVPWAKIYLCSNCKWHSKEFELVQSQFRPDRKLHDSVVIEDRIVNEDA